MPGNRKLGSCEGSFSFSKAKFDRQGFLFFTFPWSFSKFSKTTKKRLFKGVRKKEDFITPQESKISNLLEAIRKIEFFFKKQWQNYLQKRGDHFFFDLTKLAKDKLLNLGVKEERIEDFGICTFCQGKRFFSARKIKKENSGEKIKCFATFIGLLKNKKEICSLFFFKIKL